MVAVRAARSIGLTILLAAGAAAVALGQDSAPAELTPQAVLKSHDLERASSFWVLASAEKNVLKDLADARASYQQVYAAMMRQQEMEIGAETRKENILELRERSAILGQQLMAMDQQLNSLVSPPGGNNFVNQQRNQLSQQRNILAAQNNQVTNMLNTLQEQARDQGQDQEQKLQLSAKVAQNRERYMQAVLDLRKSVDDLTTKYDELSKNHEVTKALEATFRLDQDQAEAGAIGKDPGSHQAAGASRGLSQDRNYRVAPRERRRPCLRQSRQGLHENGS